MNNRDHFERTFAGKLSMSRCDMVPELYAMERTQVAWEAYQEGTCRPAEEKYREATRRRFARECWAPIKSGN